MSATDRVEDDCLHVADLRPFLGDLNWQLRRIGLGLEIIVDGDLVLSARIMPSSMTDATCDTCSHVFLVGRIKYPVCPRCGAVEFGNSAA